jgi:hypothetical protein
MNRRAVTKYLIAIPLASAPIPTKAADFWIFLGKRIVGPNTRSVSFAIDSETKGVTKLGIELRGNSIWLYDLKFAAADGNRVIHPVNLNIPPSSDGCIPRIRIWRTGEQPKNVRLSLNCLPLTGKPTEILLWGSVWLAAPSRSERSRNS